MSGVLGCFFSKIGAFFAAMAAAVAAFFLFIGWKLGLCSKQAEKKEEVK
ncbi:MAG: hypothetical protein LBB38_01565 [Puniceicoccales bacterium]|jgi:hypothetical protein|nr:hypothetical protein [Puniceicoccales bacterium]